VPVITLASCYTYSAVPAAAWTTAASTSSDLGHCHHAEASSAAGRRVVGAIILFTIYGAFLQHSGAGKFFIDFSMADGQQAQQRRPTVVLSSFLLGAVRLWRRHHGDDRRGRLPDDGARRLRENAPAACSPRRARRHHLAAVLAAAF